MARLIIQGTNPEVFQSSRAELTDGFEPLIDSIAKVIVANQELIGNITVVGHTDSIPLQRSNPLSTNQRLSEARAETIADMLIQNGVPQDRVRSEGRAATDPVGRRQHARGPGVQPPRRGAGRKEAVTMFILRFLWAVLTSRWLWTLIGFTLLSLVIWVFGPIVRLGSPNLSRRRSSASSSSRCWSSSG